MRKYIVVALAAVAALALVAGTASARNGLRASPLTNTLTIPSLNLNGGFGTVTCPITMAITLHSSVAKTSGALAGLARVTDGTGSCSSGNSGILVGGRRVTGAQGPFHVNYISFGGTLPNIREISLQVLEVTFWIQEPSFGVTCLTARPQNITGTTTGGNPATGMRVSAQNIELEGGFGCGFSSGEMSGEGRLATATTITLI